jgi:alpha-L-rhamnosidase
MLMGIVPEPLQAGVMKRLEQEIVVKKNGHVDTGIHGTAYLIKLLLQKNRNDLVYLMANQSTAPGWRYMLDQGATTLWEQWDGQNSLLHSSFVSIGSWFLEGVAGIQLDPDKPGYQHFLIRPGIVGDLRWAKGSFDSLYGNIVSEWKISDGRLTLEVQVPPNTSARVYVPAENADSVTESGKPAGQATGIRFVGTADHTVMYEVESGYYKFSAPAGRP